MTGDWPLPFPSRGLPSIDQLKPSVPLPTRPALTLLSGLYGQLSTLNRPVRLSSVAHTSPGALNLFRTWSCKGGREASPVVGLAALCRNTLKFRLPFPHTATATTTDYDSAQLSQSTSLPYVLLPPEHFPHPLSLPLSSLRCHLPGESSWRAERACIRNRRAVLILSSFLLRFFVVSLILSPLRTTPSRWTLKSTPPPAPSTSTYIIEHSTPTSTSRRPRSLRSRDVGGCQKARTGGHRDVFPISRGE